MAMGDRVSLEGIPYFDLSMAAGKFVSSLTFFVEGQWRIWLPIGNGEFIESHGWPAEGFYYGEVAERDSDIFIHFLDFIAQKASYETLRKPLSGLHDDLFNLSASLSKIRHIHKTKSTLAHGDTRMVVTEVEYFFSLCRSMIDLFQEIACGIWEKITLNVDGLPVKKPLKSSFREMIMREGRLSNTVELQNRFGLPEAWADFYMTHAEFFLQLRKFRDNIVHSGSRVQTIFSGEDGYLVNLNFRPFAGMSVWRESERLPNDLVPIMPALGVVALKTIHICNHFSEMLEASLNCPEPLAPGMNLYMRGYFDDYFGEILLDADRRFREQPENMISS